MSTYELEDIRQFAIRRSWFIHGEGRLLSTGDYEALKSRALTISEERAAYLRAYIDGWKAARNA